MTKTPRSDAKKITEPMTVIIYGIQGSGKGTQAELLKKFFETHDPEREVLYFGMGDLLRKYNEENDNEFSRRAKQIMAEGGLLPTFVPNVVLNFYFAQQYKQNAHLILEGVARRPSQAEMLDETLNFYGRGKAHMVYLDLTIEAARERIKLRGREDDLADGALEKRFAWFNDQVIPALELLERRGHPLYDVHGERSIEEVHEEILKILGLVHTA